MKYPGIKSNKICIRSICRKLQNSVNKIIELNKWRDIPCSQIGKPSIVNISVFTNLIYKFSAILMKFQLVMVEEYHTNMSKMAILVIYKHIFNVLCVIFIIILSYSIGFDHSN